MDIKEDSKRNRISNIRILKEFGPGLITGAADDDPSGVATYTIAGAQFGYKYLWLAWLTWPLMASVQMMCAHISLASQKNLVAAVSEKFSRKMIFILVIALFIANTLNVAADLAAMADALEVLTGHRSFLFVVSIGFILTTAMIFLSYRTIARLLAWLTFFLFAYVFTALKVDTNWSALRGGSLQMNMPTTGAEWAMIVAILGTTISPYLFFWQSFQEMEEIRERPQFNFSAVKRFRRWDILFGTFISNLVMYFIIWTAAGSLHASGTTSIESSKQAALALEPLLGSSALLVYTIGILGVGFLAIPTLVGSASLAIADVLHLESGLNKKWKQAKAFYLLLVLSMILAIGLDFIDLNPIRALFYSSIVNGLLSPILIVVCLFVAKDKAIMNGKCISRTTMTVSTVAAIVMTLAAVGMFVF